MTQKECDAPQHEMDSFLNCPQIYSRKSDSARRFHYFASNFLQMLNCIILRNSKNQIMQFLFTTKIQGLTALLISLCIFTQGLKAQNTRHLKSYSEFKDYAIQWGSNKMTSELNRAVKHLQLIHGNSFNPFEAAPELLVKEMQAKAYLDETIYVDIKNDPVEWYKQELRSISYPEAGLKNVNENLKYSINLISQAFSTETNPYVKLFAIKECVERVHREIPIRIFLKGISREQDLEFLQYYIEPLRNELFYSKIPKDAAEKVPKSFKQRIKEYSNNAKTRVQKANALFLNILFSNHLPKLEIRTLMYLMDQNFPKDFLLKVFRKYPISFLEEFVEPFTKGYGNQFATLLYLFEEFHSSPTILSALKFALVNRREKHFVFHQGAILQTWQKISSLTYNGDDQIYLDWYESKLKK